MRAILYARVSTTRQADHDLSIPDQLTHGKRYCAERGHVVADILLVHSFSRFFRESYGFAFYGRELAKHGVRVVSATQEVGDDSSGLLMRSVLSAFDEYSSLETAKHARRGFWNGSKPPFDYRTIVTERHGAKEKKKLAMEPAEAEIVRRAFQLYLYGDGTSGPMGVKTVTATLNAVGHTQRSKRPFRIQTMHLMLTRTAYMGVHYFNRRDSRAGKPRPREDWVAVVAPRIIDDETFHAVQAQLHVRSPINTPPRLTKSDILLSGVARCGRCGGPMRSRTGKSGRYWYYACARKADIGISACAGCAIPMQMLDDLVTDAVCERVLEPARLGHAGDPVRAQRQPGRAPTRRTPRTDWQATHAFSPGPQSARRDRERRARRRQSGAGKVCGAPSVRARGGRAWNRLERRSPWAELLCRR